MTLNYITLGIYLTILMIVGGIFSRLNKNVSDFTRGGGQGTWWMVGTSMFMGGISAFTFTGNASAAFSSGPTFLVIYVANCVGLALCIIIGPWFRQTRAITWADIIRERFHVSVEQFTASFSLLLNPIAAATQLYALSVFCGTILDLPITWIIVVLGSIVLFYSTTGGRWAVMATDFVQGIVMFAITILVFYLSLKKIGGFEAFFQYFNDPRFAADFQLVKEPGQFAGDKFTWKWIILIFILQLQGYLSLSTAGRFLSVKDGRNAKLAALWATALMSIGMVIWFLPPMVARFLYEDQVLAMAIKEPSTASYAVIALDLLPNGLMGLMLAAMLAATMSSMDTGLNNTAGVVVNNIIPRLRSTLGKKTLTDQQSLKLCRVFTVMLGIYIILVALILSTQNQLSLFDCYLMIAAVVGLPLSMPLLLGLWIKRLHWCSYFIIIAMALIPSIYFVITSTFGDASWPIQDRLAWIYGFSLIGLFASLPLWKRSSAAYKEQVSKFYKKMHTPIDFMAEVGRSEDKMQFKVIGFTAITMGSLILLFLFLPNTPSARLQIAILAGSIILIGAILLYAMKRVSNKENGQ